MNSKRDELRLLVNSRQPIITVETAEEERLEALLFEVATEMDVPLFRWSVTKGLARYRGEAMYNSDAPEAALTNIAMVAGDGIFLLKDFARYCENDKVCRYECGRTRAGPAIPVPCPVARPSRRTRPRPRVA